MQPHKILPKLRSRATGRRAGIIELMHQARSERTQRSHLLLLHLGALQLLEAICHVAKNRFADLGATGHQIPELVLVKLKQMTRRHRLNAPGVWNVAQECHFTKSAALFNLGKSEFVLFGSPLMAPKLAVKQYPKRVRQFALLRNNLAPV